VENIEHYNGNRDEYGDIKGNWKNFEKIVRDVNKMYK
jgi:hypothetical protein